MPSLRLIEAHRADLAALTARATADLRRQWRPFDTARAARDALLELLPRMMALYHPAAATLAADWYDEAREEAEAPGSFRAIPVEPPEIESAQALARWGTAPLFAAVPDYADALTLVSGGLQRRVQDAARGTVALSAVEDPESVGWQRVGTGSCGFCRMLIGLGAVYKESTVRFASHDHCKCAAAPAFGGRPLPVSSYTPGPRPRSDAERARVRRYIRRNNL